MAEENNLLNKKEKAGKAKIGKTDRAKKYYSERSFPPRVGCVVLAIVAVIMFITAYVRLSSVWEGSDTSDYIRLAVLCAVCAVVTMLLFETYIYVEDKQLLTSPKKLFTVASLIVLTVVLSAIINLISYAFTAAFIAIILCGLLATKRTAYTMALFMASVCMLLTFTGFGEGALDKPAAVALAVFIGGTIAVLMLGGHSGRIQPIISGAVGGAAAAAALCCVRIFSGADLKSIASDGGMMFGGCLLSGIIATGLLPLFERLFDVTTDARLNELMNNNNPLLKRLMLEAPGTYHHSLIVAVMAEAAAEIVGANTLLCKTAAYYHDVGKLTSPRYFKENQGEYNIHDELDPLESAKRIIAHPKDSEKMLAKENFPSEIIRMCGQHHGDSLVYYFYSKARDLAADPDSVNIKDFQYNSKKPVTKEDAILMLADCCEAAVRALKRPTPEMIEDRVHKVITGLWQPADGQLSESPLTAKDIRLIETSFIKNLLAQYHERIEYPANHAQETPKIEAQPAVTPAAAPVMQEPVPVTVNEEIVYAEEQHSDQPKE